MWVSKKEWEKLKNKLIEYEEIQNIVVNMQLHNLYFYGDLAIMKTEYYDNLSIKLNSSELILKNMEAEIKKYRQLYLNELQKRLELAEMVRRMDGD